MLDQARQRRREFQSRLGDAGIEIAGAMMQAGMIFAVDGGISVDGRLGGRIGDSIAVTAEGSEYITEFPRKILTVNR